MKSLWVMIAVDPFRVSVEETYSEMYCRKTPKDKEKTQQPVDRQKFGFHMLTKTKKKHL